MEVIIKEEQSSRDEEKSASQHIYVNVNICDNVSDNVNVASALKCDENYTSSEEEIVALSIRDRITKFKYIDSDNNSRDLKLTNTEFSDKCGLNTEENIVVTVNNDCAERDSAREKQRENIIVQSSASNDNVGEEQIALLNVVVEVTVANEQQVHKELFCCGRVLRFIANLTKEQADGFSKLSHVQMYCGLIITILFSVLDIGTDVWLMCQYFLDGQYIYGSLTLVFVWVPAFINTYWLYGICDINKNTWLYQIRKKKWLLIIFYIVPLASVVIAFNNFMLFWKSKMDIKDSRVKTVYLLQLQMIDSYLEALPQLTLQLCVIMNNVEQETQDTSFLNMLRWVSMALSVITVARVQYSYETCYSDNIGVKEAATQFICTIFLIVSRVFVVSMGFTVSPTVTGVCLLLHSGFVAVVWYRENRELQVTVIGSIIASAQNTTMSMFYYGWYLSNPVICLKLFARTFSYTVYTLQCVVFTTLWCVLNSSTHGTVWYYAVPAVPVLLYILCIPAALLNRHFVKKRIAAERQRQLELLKKQTTLVKRYH